MTEVSGRVFNVLRSYICLYIKVILGYLLCLYVGSNYAVLYNAVSGLFSVYM